jgi:restriction endonuclease fold toxin 5 of polymorphic toxin system
VEAREAARDIRRSRVWPPRVIVNPERMHLELGDLVVKSTGDGGYVCIGFGAGARFLELVETDPCLNAAIDIKEREVTAEPDHPLANDDRYLRRLGIAIAIAKSGGYDPDEPRDDHGRWTDEGASSEILAALSLFDGDIGSKVLGALRLMVSRLNEAATVLDIVLVPTNKSLITEGPVPDAPGISFKYDAGTGRLILRRENDDGTPTDIYSSHSGADGLFRDDDGSVLGRRLGNGVMLDGSAIPGHKSQSNDDDNQPKLCPDPGSDTAGWPERSPRSLAYQSMISGLPPGIAVNLGGVSFDGCRQSDGVMLEAKGPNIAQHMDDDGGWEPYFIASRGLRDLQDQIVRQSKAAGAAGKQVEWYVAEEPVADYLREYAREMGLSNITVFYFPEPGPKGAP